MKVGGDWDIFGVGNLKSDFCIRVGGTRETLDDKLGSPSNEMSSYGGAKDRVTTYPCRS
jgi:hypothetical protein